MRAREVEQEDIFRNHRQDLFVRGTRGLTQDVGQSQEVLPEALPCCFQKASAKQNFSFIQTRHRQNIENISHAVEERRKARGLRAPQLSPSAQHPHLSPSGKFQRERSEGRTQGRGCLDRETERDRDSGTQRERKREIWRERGRGRERKGKR